MSDWVPPLPTHRSPEHPHMHGLLDDEGAESNLDSATTALSHAYVPELCAAVRTTAERCSGPAPLASIQTIPARRTISHPTEWCESALVISRGWATSSLALPDAADPLVSSARRSRLLPGDLACSSELDIWVNFTHMINRPVRRGALS
jgi:hypothetical protein